MLNNMKANGSLPSNYCRYATLEPSKQPKFIIGAVVAGIGLLLVVGWLFATFANALRPAALDGMRLQDLFRSTPTGSSFAIPPGLFRDVGLALIAVLIFHEIVHGLFYWLFSSQRPRFGFQGLFPYAAAPNGIYFPRNQFLMVGLSPLVILSAVGLLLMAIAPIAYVPFILFFVAFNAAGGAGDLIMVVQLMGFSADCVMEDSGSGVIVYGPEKDSTAGLWRG
jgi:Putative zincin peptidase